MSLKHCIDLTFAKEVRLDDYSTLIDAARHACSSFTVIEQPDIGLESTAHKVLYDLQCSLLRQEVVSEWPGTKLAEKSAVLREYALNDVTASILKEADGLYAWCQPYLPEDLTFWRADGTPWLVSIAHEHDAYLRMTAREWEDVRRRYPNIAKLVNG